MQILLGTQMIAKGLDFPNVTLVGVVNADTALHMPDFRAAERTFQLVAQVAGRTGRGDRPGRVLVQTYCPDHHAIRCAARHDYEGFVALELPEREQYGMPPFGRLVRLIARGAEEPAVKAYLEELARALKTAAPPAVQLHGPAPAPVLKIRNLYRYHLRLRLHRPSTAPGTLADRCPHPPPTERGRAGHRCGPSQPALIHILEGLGPAGGGGPPRGSTAAPAVRTIVLRSV